MGLPLFVAPPDNGVSPRPGDKETSNERTTIRRQRSIRRGRGTSTSQRLHHHWGRTGGRWNLQEEPGSVPPEVDFNEAALLDGSARAAVEERHRRAVSRSLRLRDQLEGRWSFRDPAILTSQMQESASSASEDRITRAAMEERRRRAQMQGAPVAIPSPWADRSTPPLPPSTTGNPAPRVMPPNPWGWNAQPDGPLLPPAPESPPSFTARAAWRSTPPTGYDRRVVIQRLYNERVQARRARSAAAAQSQQRSRTVTERNAYLTAQLSELMGEQLTASDAEPVGMLPPWIDSSMLSQLRDEPRTSALPPSNNSMDRRRFRVPRVDGLGDRDRSLSPDGDGAWDTLLTTISPDPQPPSAGSSFASTSASEAASSLPTSTSSAPFIMPRIDIANDASFELVCEYVEANSPSSNPDDDEQEMLDFFDAGESEERFWRGYTDIVAARADQVARHASQTDGENMGGMQRIVQRLARREDIPDEWWAEVGLSRTIPLELVQS